MTTSPENSVESFPSAVAPSITVPGPTSLNVEFFYELFSPNETLTRNTAYTWINPQTNPDAKINFSYPKA